MTYQLEFLNKIKGSQVKKADFAAAFKKGIEALKKEIGPLMKGGEVHLTLVDDAEIKEINAEYRNLNRATDVVSLSYFEQEEAQFPTDNLIGEIFISIDTAARQAKKQKHSLKKELVFLFVHGLLHVFGYDHLKAGERKIMFALQDKIAKV